MNLLILSSHSILEYDDLRLFDDLGYDTFIPGGYSDPSNPGEHLRPALPDVKHFPELAALCHEQRVKHADVPAGPGIVDWAKADLHPDLIDWADVIMVNCFPVEWITPQWGRIRHKRVIWRTIGQSNPWVEHEMTRFTHEGLEVVRYSPAERRAFEPSGIFAGENAMIRFAKYPGDFEPWVGDIVAVGNITQNLDQRGDHCGLDFWLAATQGLPTMLAGLGSERLGGIGTLDYPAMLDYLRHLRAYLYMGTQPASYTLGLMEAMLAGVPVVSIGPEGMWLPPLFEGHELTEPLGSGDLAWTRGWLEDLLGPTNLARNLGTQQRDHAIELFSADVIGPQWKEYLG